MRVGDATHKWRDGEMSNPYITGSSAKIGRFCW